MTLLYATAGVLIIPLVLAGIWAHRRVRQLYVEYSRKPTKKAVTGMRLARTMLHSAGLDDVVIEEINGSLKDHYDPRQKIVRLSRDVARGTSIAAIGIAAHEAAHAIQDGTSYPPVKLRNSMAPIVEGTAHLVLPFVLIGFLLSGLALSSIFISIGLLMFIGVVFFYLVTLPVELEASSRALQYIRENEVVDRKELEGVEKVLRAAAFTYLVAMALVVVQFISLLAMYRRR